MKTLSILILFFSQFVLAGNGQGNMRVGDKDQLKQAISGSQTIFTKDPKSVLQFGKTQIIYTINRENSITEFAVANAVDNKWEIQKYAAPDSVIENSEFSQLIHESSSAKEWIEIQK